MENLIATLIASFIFVMGLHTGSQILTKSRDAESGRTAAEQMKTLKTAVNQLVLDNYNTLVATTPVGAPGVVLSNNCLISPSSCFPGGSSQGYVPPGYKFVNAYDQTWEISIAQPVAGTLEALIASTGGNLIPHQTLPYVASQSGADGGFVPYATAGVYNAYAGQALGTNGTWSVPLSQFFTGSQVPKGGHLADLLYYKQGAQSSNYLYTTQVPGQPQLNQMLTGLTLAYVPSATLGQPCYNQLPPNPTYFPLGTLVSTAGGAVLDCIQMSPGVNQWQNPMNWNTGVDSYVFGPGSYTSVWSGAIPGYGGWAQQLATNPSVSLIGGGKYYHICLIQNPSQYTWNQVGGNPPYMGYGDEGGVAGVPPNEQNFSTNLYPVTNPTPSGEMQWWFYAFGEMQSGAGPMTPPTYSVNCF